MHSHRIAITQPLAGLCAFLRIITCGKLACKAVCVQRCLRSNQTGPAPLAPQPLARLTRPACRNGWQSDCSGNDMKKLKTESVDWIKYRSAYPSRRNSGRLNFTRRPQPGKPDQRAWHVYEQRNEHQCQQWVLVPTLNPVSQLTEPLAGAPQRGEFVRV